MKRQNKRAIFFICMLLCTIVGSIGFSGKVYAAESARVSVGSASASIGDQVTVSVTIKTSSTLVGGEIWISYDHNILDYVSGGSSGGGGNIRLLNAGETSYSLIFQAKSAGKSAINVSSTVLSVGTELNAATTISNGSITVNAPITYSTDNTLSSLSISPGVLSPAFSPNVTEYTSSVGADCSQLIVSAVANDDNAKVSVSGTRMDPGNNTTSITVKAQNGATRVYKISTTKDATDTKAGQSATEPATQIQTTPDGQTQVQYNDDQAQKSLDVKAAGAAYTINNDFKAHPLPSGYEATDYDYNGQHIQVGKGINTKLVLMYLDNSDGKGTSGFYVYDSVNKSFTPYNEVSEPEITYVILPITDSMEKPDGYYQTTYTINDKNVAVLMAPAGSYCLFYGVSSQGVTGWFTYNSTDGTIQPYVMDGSIAAVAQTASASDHVQMFWEILAIAMSVTTAGLLIILIVQAGKASKNKKVFVNAIRGESQPQDEIGSDILEDTQNDDLRDVLEDVLSDASIQKKDAIQHDSNDVEDDLVANITQALSNDLDKHKQTNDYEFLEIEELSEKKNK